MFLLSSRRCVCSHDTGRFVLEALIHAIYSMSTHFAPLNLFLRRANAHDTIGLIFAKPCFLRLPQNSFADVVEEVT